MINNKKPKKICIFVGSRANYSSIKSVMLNIKSNSNLELQTVVGASALLDRFGKVADLIVSDGFNIDYSFHSIVEGENPTTMAKSTGLGIIEMSMVLDNLKPDFVLIVGDRFEMMSIAIAAAYMNIRIAHTMGGEVTGTIDESIRHSITKFSHIHFPSNEDSKERIIKLGENPDYVFNVGCPRIDLVKEELSNNSKELLKGKFTNEFKGIGYPIDFDKPFLMVSQHPVTTEYGDGRKQIEETLKALNELKIQTLLLWPNIDAGSDDISKGIRTFRENYDAKWLTAYVNVPTKYYIHLMNSTSCLIGNSSSGIREGAFIGTPTVNIGTRQKSRVRGKNVFDVPHDSLKILEGIKLQISKGKYPLSEIYGNGEAGKKIVTLLEENNPPLQKQITY